MSLGTSGEAVAVRYLLRKGHQIVDTNYRCRIGEIDIVSCDGSILVFSEVKTRQSVRMGQPFESVTIRKQHTLRRLAEHFMLSRYGSLHTCRFDVISIRRHDSGTLDILHIENAF